MKLGTRVMLRPGHPHCAEFGMIIDTDEVLDGASTIKVRLEDCRHGTDECFAFPGDWRPVHPT